MNKDENITLLPKLRFPEFEKKENWENEILSNLGEFTGGGTPSKGNASYWKGSIPWVSSSDIFEESIHKINPNRFITNEALDKSATKIVPKNSILIVSRVGVGKLAISKQDLCTSQDFTNFTPYKDNLVFLAYYLKSQRKTLLGYSQGMAIKGFTKDDIANLELSIPISDTEQQKIADCLSSLDDYISAENKKLELLKNHKKGLMQQLFPAEGEKEPKLRFPEFRGSGEWEEKSIDEIANVIASGDLDSDNYSSNITKDHYYPIYSNSIAKEGLYGYCTYPKYKKNSVTITARGTLGVAFLRSNDFYGIGRLLIVSDFDNISPRFFKENWNFFAKVPLENGGIPQLTAVKAKNVFLKFPKIKEQDKIADCLASLDDLISNQEQKIDKLKNHKKGLMQNLFPNPNDEVS